jgi:hypothetical protein
VVAVILALGRWRQEQGELEFKTSLGCIRPCLKKQAKTKIKIHYRGLRYLNLACVKPTV